MLAPSGVSFGAVQGNRQSNLIPGAPFRPDPLTKIFAVRFSQGGDSKQGTVLVPHYLIYDYLEHARGRPGYRVDWCNWGQYETLVINTTGVIFDPASPPIPYGSRFPLLMTERGFELCGRVVVFDLNPTLAEAARRCGSKAGGAAHTVVRVPDVALAKARQGAMVMVNCHGQPLLVPVSSMSSQRSPLVLCGV